MTTVSISKIPKLLSVHQVAEVTAMSVTSIRRLVDAGKIAAIRPGGRKILLRESDVLAFLDASTERRGPDWHPPRK